MTDELESISAKLENAALRLSWKDSSLHVQNRLSGQAHELSFPAFAMRLEGEDLTGDSFTLTDLAATPDEVVFSYRHENAGIGAEVKYWLEGDKPWFRKQVTLRTSPGTLTPERVWVDIQEDPPAPLRQTESRPEFDQCL